MSSSSRVLNHTFNFTRFSYKEFMKSLSFFHSLIRWLSLCLLSLLFCSCILDEFKAKRELSRRGYEEFSISDLEKEIKRENTEVAVLMVQSGLIKKESMNKKEEVFFQALGQEKIGVIRSLLQTDLALPKVKQSEALRKSVEMDSLANIRILLENDFPKTFMMEDGGNPVSYCISKGQHAMAKLLTTCNVSLKAKDDADEPLWLAVENEAPNWLVEQLAIGGADTNFTTKQGVPILHEIILNCSDDAVKALLLHDAKVGQLDAENKTSVFKAIATQEVSMVKVLADSGAELSHTDEEGRNYLHVSILFGDAEELAEYLLDQGVDLNDKTNEGKNALDLALEYSRMETAKLLFRKNAFVSSGTFDRLYQAGNKEALTMLIKAGQVDANSSLTNGDSLLIDSVKQSDLDIVKTLLEQGADPNARAIDGEPPFSYAVAMQNLECMRILHEAGAKVEYRFKSPPASRFKELIETEGAIKWFIQRDRGITPIMMACDQGDLETCKFLMENGAKNRSSSKYGFWPGNFAARRSITDIVQYTH